jgi:hypothetical protein
MTFDQLLADLAHNQVVVYMDGDRLRYRAPEGALTADMRMAIGEHRTAIVNHLQGDLPLISSYSGNCINCDRQNWVDEPAQNGRIRTVCSRCGHFVGYRPENP